jgi:hypothetical protein
MISARETTIHGKLATNLSNVVWINENVSSTKLEEWCHFEIDIAVDA